HVVGTGAASARVGRRGRTARTVTTAAPPRTACDRHRAAPGVGDVPPAPPEEPEPGEPPDDGPAVVSPPPPPAPPGPPGEPAVVPVPPEGLPPGEGAPVLAPAPEPPGEHSWLGLGFVPVLSTDLTRVGRVRHFLSMNVLVGISGGSSGLAISGIADIQRGLVGGFQVAGVVALAPRVVGTQVAGVAAVAGDLDGVQIAGTAAVADRVDGVQAAGIAAVSRSTAGHQAAGIATFARGSASTQLAGIATFSGGDAGLQLAGVATVARHNANIQAAGIASVAGNDANFQAGGIASVARGTANIQLAGLVNVARRLRGVQIAPINVAREVDGVQIGVINVGGSADGFSFGLINIVPGGRYDLESAVDSSKMGTLLFRHGGRRWHNVYGIGGHPVKEDGPSDDVWMYGMGFGPSLRFDNTVIDLETIAWQVNHGPRHESDISILGQLRLSIAHHWGPFAVVVGGVLNGYVTNDQQSPLILERRTSGDQMQRGVTLTTWPSAFIGLRI
ncbi:MAG TPA: hypothetical protein VLM79_13100, partial [Kofleriaceae bacterium]|nr:hypothetical protein [Kofleriaceae bacterium]